MPTKRSTQKHSSIWKNVLFLWIIMLLYTFFKYIIKKKKLSKNVYFIGYIIIYIYYNSSYIPTMHVFVLKCL